MRLFHKLLIAMFATTALVLIVNALVSRTAVSGAFVDFLRQEEQARIDPKIPELARLYDAESGWDSVQRDPRRFLDLFKPDRETELGQDSLPSDLPPRRPDNNQRRPPPFGREGAPPPPPERDANRPTDLRPDGRRSGRNRGRARPQGFESRIFLLDAQRELVAGAVPKPPAEQAASPVLVNDQVVGWLGVASRNGNVSLHEQAFLARQQAVMWWALGIGLAIAGFLAWLLARHLSAPVAAAAGAIKELAAGRFGDRLKVTGKDEIATLGEDVNRLAATLSANESARQRWTADIAHELRTPLAILKGELEAIDDGVRQADAKGIALIAGRSELSEQFGE